jgi:hypothetical protein
LPPVFWGALGCVSVLGVGFTIMFLVLRPSAAPAAPLPPPATAAVVAPPPAPAPAARPTPDIQPLAAPGAAPAAAPEAEAHPVHKPVVHPVKVARVQPKADKKAHDPTGDSVDDADQAPVAKKAGGDQAPVAKKAGGDKPAADQGSADEDQPVTSHRERASDDPEDE